MLFGVPLHMCNYYCNAWAGEIWFSVQINLLFFNNLSYKTSLLLFDIAAIWDVVNMSYIFKKILDNREVRGAAPHLAPEQLLFPF